ncbi:MAG: NADH:flavin oxidoreductase [Candidatus Omnitrophica bacterium]|nr:NADH:flavin oxidoreductase [Candidatus Omnitrophota bacterium]
MQNILFEKEKIGELELKNRFLMSAGTGTWNADQDNIPHDGDGYIHFEIASGGVAMVISGGLNVSPSGVSTSHSGMFADDRSAPFMSIFAKRIKDGGALACLQISHGGMWAWKYAKKRNIAPFAPSFIVDAELGDYSVSRRIDLPATEGQICELIEAYGNAALRAKKCGFDAVEVHAAHEALLSQMLSPVSNIRKDKWGGSVENRARFHIEVLRNIRSKVGKSFPVIMKLGVKDMLEGGLSFEDGVAAAKIIVEKGGVDAIEVSQGLSPGLLDFAYSSMRTGITRLENEGYYRHWAKLVKGAISHTGAKVIMQGGLRSFELMQEVIEKKEADFVSMCRPYICESAIIKRWMGSDRKKSACISCNKCIIRAYTEGKKLECVLKSGNGG